MVTVLVVANVTAGPGVVVIIGVEKIPANGAVAFRVRQETVLIITEIRVQVFYDVCFYTVY